MEQVNEVKRNNRKERIGVVVSNKMQKSIVFAVKRKVKLPIYGKIVTQPPIFMLTTKKMKQGRRFGSHYGDTPSKQTKTLEVS
jgi:small subunit ribosomal protein S17